MDQSSRVPRVSKHTIVLKTATLFVVAGIVLAVRTTGALQPVAVTVASTPVKTETEDTTTPQEKPVAEVPTPEAPAVVPTPAAPAPTPSAPVVTPKPTPTPTPAPPAPNPTPPPAPTPPPPAPTYTYRNGTYSADGSFSTPGGTEKIGITLVIVNDVVTDTSAVNKSVDSTSRSYTNDFIANYKSKVVGKSLASLSLSKVSSASITPIGFNNAAQLIRSQAL